MPGVELLTDRPLKGLSRACRSINQVEGVSYMSKRTAVVAATAVTMLLQVAPTTTASARATATYTFEECAQGWKVSSRSSQPTPTSAWHRAGPGAGSSWNEASTTAFYHGPPYASDAHEYLTSPAHRWGGGTLKLGYQIKYDYQQEPTREAEEGIHVQWSRNGRTWRELAYHGDGTALAFEHHSHKFRAPRGKVFIRFHALSDAVVEHSGGAVDNVTLSTKAPKASKC